jgi:hypothetical protein
VVGSSQSAPVVIPTGHHHLLSLVHPLNRLSVDFPWRTFTLSWSLPSGVWLLRRLRPRSHSLAFSRPLRARWGKSSLISLEEVLRTFSRLRQTGEMGDDQRSRRKPLPLSYLLVQASHPVFRLSRFTILTRRFQASPRRQVVGMGPRGRGVFSSQVENSPVIERLHTLRLAKSERMLSPPYVVVERSSQ